MIEIKSSFEKLKYSTPVPVRGVQVSENRFLKITLLERDYFFSVLPGFHQVNLEEMNYKINSFFKENSFNLNAIDFNKQLFNTAPVTDLHPEILFAVETLLLGMIKTSRSDLFLEQEILKNDLFRAERGLNFYQNSKCLKLKITPSSLEKTIALITELHKMNHDLNIRLDGNRFFELEELLVFSQELKERLSPSAFSKIDYFEEPLKNFYESAIFEKKSGLFIAMDESFTTAHDYPLVVIKPSLFGLSSIHNWMEKHSKNRAIISSSFEHPSVRIGLDFLAQKRALEFHGLENFF